MRNGHRNSGHAIGYSILGHCGRCSAFGVANDFAHLLHPFAGVYLKPLHSGSINSANTNNNNNNYFNFLAKINIYYLIFVFE